MLRVSIAVISLHAALANLCYAAPDKPSDVIAELPENIKGQLRWIRAERDRANAVLARDFIGKQEQGESDKHCNSDSKDH